MTYTITEADIDRFFEEQPNGFKGWSQCSRERYLEGLCNGDPSALLQDVMRSLKRDGMDDVSPDEMRDTIKEWIGHNANYLFLEIGETFDVEEGTPEDAEHVKRLNEIFDDCCVSLHGAYFVFYDGCYTWIGRASDLNAGLLDELEAGLERKQRGMDLNPYDTLCQFVDQVENPVTVAAISAAPGERIHPV